MHDLDICRNWSTQNYWSVTLRFHGSIGRLSIYKASRYDTELIVAQCGRLVFFFGPQVKLSWAVCVNVSIRQGKQSYFILQFKAVYFDFVTENSADILASNEVRLPEVRLSEGLRKTQVSLKASLAAGFIQTACLLNRESREFRTSNFVCSNYDKYLGHICIQLEPYQVLYKLVFLLAL